MSGSHRSGGPPEYGVVGATGNQGGAVVRALLQRGATVRALVRDPAGRGGVALAGLGARVVRADTDDPAGLLEAFAGLAGLFAMTVFAGHGPAGEVVQGRAIVDAAVAARLPHVVYSSVGGADRGSGVPHFESKWAVEQHLRRSGLDSTVIRPVFFMDNFLNAMAPVVRDGATLVRAPLAPGVPLQMIAVRDVGAIAATALFDPSAVVSGAVEVAGDELTPEQIAEALARRDATTGRFEPLPLDTVGDPDSRAMFAWLSRRPAYQADLGRTRRLLPRVQDFRGFLQGTGPVVSGG